MWIGIDDTDSKNGGCTTHVAGMVLSSLQKSGMHLIGFPRLVRLNPNVPWKTRGNGAVSFQLDIGKGDPSKIGRMNGVDILSYSSKEKQMPISMIQKMKDILQDTIQLFARLSDKNTNPGLVMVVDQFKEDLYWQTVQRIMSKDEMVSQIHKQNGWYHEFKNGRGIIGATASIAWRGLHDSTFELIAYRQRKRWGSKRFVAEKSVKLMDEKHASTFDNYDYINNHNNIVPNSPCPVLLGIRGNSANKLPECINLLETESFNDWLIFASNQGTDDHLIPRSIDNIHSFQSVITTGKVKSKPITIAGGHVIFSISDKKNKSIDCAAYEPTKQFRNIIRQLEPGDTVKVFGGVRQEPFTVNLEKIEILHLNDVYIKIENPVCPICGKHMKSIGKNQGFRCKTCKTKSEKTVVKKKERLIQETLYEVPVCARRHLSKPLKRMSQIELD